MKTSYFRALLAILLMFFYGDTQREENTNLPDTTASYTLPEICDISLWKKRSKAGQCRELLNQIKHYTYLVYEDRCLNALHACLTDALEIVKLSAPNNDGIVLNEEEGMQEQIKVQRKAAVANVHQTLFVELPKRKSRRSKFTGRVGEGVMKRKQALKVSINEIYTPQSETTVIEEPVPVVPDIDDYVLSLHLADYSSLPPEGTNRQSASDTDLESDVEVTMPDQDHNDDVVITDVKGSSETSASPSKRRKLFTFRGRRCHSK